MRYHSFKLSLIVVFLFVGVCLCMARAEEKSASPEDASTKAEEGVSTAPDSTDLLRKAMEDFHEIMAPLWHQAFPENDFKTIREKAPLLQEKLMHLSKVKLPTYLVEDEEKLKSFASKKQELVFYVGQVNLAAADTVDSTLASSFEQMHWAYEELEKVFAVPIKELDSFHENLYFVWHKALPQKDYDAIRKTAPVLKAKVDSLMKVSLPYGCAKKKSEFEKRKSALKDAVYELAENSQKGSEDDIERSLKALHERFVELNQLLR